MRALIVLACAPLLVGFAPAAPELPEHRIHVWACGGPAPPDTPAKWHAAADLIVRARIESQFAFVRDRSNMPREVITAHLVSILDVVKADPRGGPAGATQQILQWGGRHVGKDAVYIQTWNGSQTLAVGTEWILFLKWDGRFNGFFPMHFDAGAVRIEDGKVATGAGSRLRTDWSGRTVVQFIQALRHE